MKLIVAFRSFANAPKNQTSKYKGWRPVDWVNVAQGGAVSGVLRIR